MIVNLVKATIVSTLYFLCAMPLTTILHAFTPLGNVIAAHAFTTIEFNKSTGGALLPLLIYLTMVRLVYTVRFYQIHINALGATFTFQLPLPRRRIRHRRRLRGSAARATASTGLQLIHGQRQQHGPATRLALCIARDVGVLSIIYFTFFAALSATGLSYFNLLISLGASMLTRAFSGLRHVVSHDRPCLLGLGLWGINRRSKHRHVRSTLTFLRICLCVALTLLTVSGAGFVQGGIHDLVQGGIHAYGPRHYALPIMFHNGPLDSTEPVTRDSFPFVGWRQSRGTRFLLSARRCSRSSTTAKSGLL